MPDQKQPPTEQDHATLVPLRLALQAGRTPDPDEATLARALRTLADEPLAEPSDAAWAEIARATARQATQRRWRYHFMEWWRSFQPAGLRVAMGAAALACLALVLGASLPTRVETPQPLAQRGLLFSLRHLGNAGRWKDQLALDAGAHSQHLVLRAGAQLVLSTGQLQVEQADRNRPALHLAVGRVALAVPPIVVGGQLVVHTADAQVIVHGTRFSVERPSGHQHTLVAVEEGLVEVRPEGGHRPAVFLRAGESLLVESLPAYRESLRTQVSALIEHERCDAPSDQILTRYFDAVAPSEDISAARYLRGTCAAARGDTALAVSLLEQVAQSAGSALRKDNALARSAQLRAERSPAEGVGAWQQYLDRFPNGQHRATAQRFLQRSPRLSTP